MQIKKQILKNKTDLFSEEGGVLLKFVTNSSKPVFLLETKPEPVPKKIPEPEKKQTGSATLMLVKPTWTPGVQGVNNRKSGCSKIIFRH